MDDFKQTFYFSKRERIAIVAILIVMLLVVLANFIPIFHSKPAEKPMINLDSIYELQTAARNELLEKQKSKFEIANPEQSTAEVKLTPFPFNPNMLPEDDWKKIGLTDKQIRTIKNYEQKGGKFYRKEDVKKMYCISEAEYKILEPYIVIPDYSQSRLAKATTIQTPEPKQKAEENKTEILETPAAIIDINKADSLELMTLPGIGQWFAHRILKYRSQLSGFYDKTQLLEVNKMDSAKFIKIEKYIHIDTTKIQKVRINHLEFKSLLKHPYFSYEMTKAIVNHRERKGMIANWQQLSTILKTKDLENKYLKHYITFD